MTVQVDHDGAKILARLDRIPVWALPTRYLVIIGLGYFFTFFDIANIGVAMPAISKQFHLSDNESLFVALAIGLVGYILGSLAIGPLADHFGRYRLLILTITLTAIGSFGDAAAQGLISLVLFRFITGAGVGADLNLVSTYIGELAPASRRGRVTVGTFLVGILGQAVTPFVALALVPNYSFGWRLLFAIGGVIAVIGLLLRFELPESPRWQVLHERLNGADETVKRMEFACRSRGIRLPEPPPDPPVSRAPTLGVRSLFHTPYARRLTLLIPMWFMWYIGNYGFLGDTATLLSAHGLTVSSTILFLAIGAVGYPVGALLMMMVVDRFDRRLTLLGSSAIWLIGMILIGWAGSDAAVTAGSFLAALALGMFLQGAYTFTAESFPTRARSSGFAMSDGIGHLGGAVGALLLPVTVSQLSFFAGFAIIGMTGLLAGLLAVAGPVTTNRRLEHISI
ncbi:MFS transporter [Streptomyces sp. 1222.5]|uniref:MFS transporter n=1 Tax=Streptomyces sp. 1222.5 TaxID=1881026 RepID=UPI003EBBBDDD